MKKYDVVRIKKIDGRDKPIYENCGVLIMKDDGKISLKINTMPVGDWDGWLSCFEQRPREEAF